MIYVGVCLDLKLGYHAQIARGIARFRSTRPHWTFIETAPEHLHTVPFPLRGMIGHFIDPERDQEAFEQKQIPVAVSITNHQPGPFPWSQVISDDREIGHMAARYFLRKRFRNLAAWGLIDLNFSNERIEGFCEELNRHGIEGVQVYMQKDRRHLAKLRARLPLAIFAVSDLTATSLMGYLQHEGLRIPHDVALLGVDNDPIECELCPVLLSSIVLQFAETGRQAARLLGRMMQGGSVSSDPVLLKPLRIEERISTDPLRVEDLQVRRILARMKVLMSAWPGVEALAEEMGVSKRSLEIRFREATGETVHQRLQRMRVEEAKRLFREERVSVTEAAERVGVQDINRFGQLFRKQTGMTAREYRRVTSDE